jgi:hypothetical protein
VPAGIRVMRCECPQAAAEAMRLAGGTLLHADAPLSAPASSVLYRQQRSFASGRADDLNPQPVEDNAKTSATADSTRPHEPGVSTGGRDEGAPSRGTTSRLDGKRSGDSEPEFRHGKEGSAPLGSEAEDRGHVDASADLHAAASAAARDKWFDDKYASTTKAVAVLLRNRSCRNPARTQLAPAHLHAS